MLPSNSSSSSVGGGGLSSCRFKGKFFKPNTCDLCGLPKSQHATQGNKATSPVPQQQSASVPVSAAAANNNYAAQPPPNMGPTYASLPTVAAGNGVGVSGSMKPGSSGNLSSGPPVSPAGISGQQQSAFRPTVASVPVQSGNPAAPPKTPSATPQSLAPAAARSQASGTPAKTADSAYYSSPEAVRLRKLDEDELLACWEQALEHSDSRNCSAISGMVKRIKDSKHWSQSERTRVSTDIFGRIVSHLYEQYRLHPRSVEDFYSGAPLAHTCGYILQTSDEYMRKLCPDITVTIENQPLEIERFSFHPAGGPDISSSKYCYQFIVWLFAAFGHLNSAIEDNGNHDRVTPRMAAGALKIIEPAITSIFGGNFPLRKKILSLNENSPPLNSGDPHTDEAWERLKRTVSTWLEVSTSLRETNHCMHDMVHLLDDEKILVLNADEQWGCVVKIRGISTNFQLTLMLTNTLYAYSNHLRQSLPVDLQGLFTLWQPIAPHLWSTLTGEGPWTQEDVYLDERWTMWNYFAVERLGLSSTGRPLFRCAKDGDPLTFHYRVFGECIPSDIEKCEYFFLPTVEPKKEGDGKIIQQSLENERKEEQSRFIAACHAEMIAGTAVNPAYGQLSINAATAAVSSSSSGVSVAPLAPPKLSSAPFENLPSRVLILSRRNRPHSTSCMRVYPHVKAGCYYERTLSHQEVIHCLSAFADCGTTFRNKAEHNSKKRIGAPMESMNEFQNYHRPPAQLQLAQLLGIGFQRR